jgi:uncharacterized protein YecE (DUF72 family)
MGEIMVGISGWTEPTLIAGGKFYPPSVKSAEARLKFYAGQFSIVEVDSIYYGLPTEATSGLWVDRTPEKFVFDVKAFRLFTQHQTGPEVLPKDIRKRLAPDLAARKNIYYRDLSPELRNELWRRFELALLPLDSAGKLGVVLFQFPSWFLPGKEQLEYLAWCKQKLAQYQIAVEFRNSVWLSQINAQRTLAFLRENQLSYVCVDEPQGFESSVPPVAASTSQVGVIRFHGRNRQTWERGGLKASGRFNYLYSENELKEWIPRIESLAAKTRQLHIIFNNCYDDKQIRNAKQIRTLLGQIDGSSFD